MAPTGSPQPEWVQTCPVSGLRSPWRSQVLRAAQGSHTLQGWGGAEALFLIVPRSGVSPHPLPHLLC